MRVFSILLFVSLFCVFRVHAQHNIGTGSAKDLYLKYCANCHGSELQGSGIGRSLTDDQWRYGESDENISHIIKNGNTKVGMPAWSAVFTDEQIRSLVILIREEEKLSLLKNVAKTKRFSEEYITTEKHSFKLDEVAKGTNILWGMDFLPNGDLLTTQQDGKLWLLKKGEGFKLVRQTPSVLYAWQGGLLDIKVHPNHKKNGWIYLSFSESSDDGAMTSIVRGKITNKKWHSEEKIFSAPKKFHIDAGHHYGSRIVLKNNYIFFSIGDRGERAHAQNIHTPNGKIHRLHDDGRIPQDNPFSKNKNAYQSIWSLGHRNPQGLDIQPGTNNIWSSEHGPRGGDEINLIYGGKNYGWPQLTHGMNYDGSPISSTTGAPGFESPRHYWTPSISPSGIAFYDGDVFQHWKYNLFVAGMGSTELHRLVIDDNEVVHDEILMSKRGRIRDIATGPDGYMYLLINTRKPNRGSVYRLVPK